MENMEYLKWIKPSIKSRSLEQSEFRYKKAEEQINLPIVEKEEIIKYVNEFLSKIGMITTDDLINKITDAKDFNPVVTFKSGKWKKGQIRYYDMADKYGYEKENIVWIKMTKDNYISVIGTACDIGFGNDPKKYTTAEKILERLKTKYPERSFECNDEMVLIFPLKNIPEGLNRSDIESGIGNYLISKNVPILDFYSHDY